MIQRLVNRQRRRALLKVWGDVICAQCGKKGLLPGEDGMEMVLFPGAYAHYRCAIEGWAERGIPCPGCQKVPCDHSSGACLLNPGKRS